MDNGHTPLHSVAPLSLNHSEGRKEAYGGRVGETTERLWGVGVQSLRKSSLPPRSGQLISQYKTLQQVRRHIAPCCLNQRGPTRKARRGG